MLITSRTLIILGLIIQALPVLLTVWRLLSGRLESRTVTQQRKKNRIDACFILICLLFSIALQGIAVLWPYLGYPD